MTRILQSLSIGLVAVMSLLHLGETPVNDQQEQVKPTVPAALGTGFLLADNCSDYGNCGPPNNCGVRG